MQHSVKYIALTHCEISALRKDKVQFDYDDFIKFAKDNMVKYGLLSGVDDMLVSSWYADSLINDYKMTLLI